MTTSLVWRLAEHLGTVPIEADEVMRQHAAGWWLLPRTFACVHGKTADPWFVVWPIPSIWCGRCGVIALESVTVCSYCSLHVNPEDGQHVVHEPADGSPVFLSSAHHHCLETS